MSFLPPRGAALVRALGAGSIFEVALVTLGGEEHICKRLRSRMLSEPVARSAMEREASVLRRVRHPSLPELIDEGSDISGPYVVESCLRGATLRELVDGWLERGSPMPPRLLGHVVRASFAALGEVHGLSTEHGALELVHGDLGPDHVLLGQQGQIFFVDFGQARWRGMDPALRGPDRGTLPFVAPELARGEVEPDQRADVFALAATLAFAALGRDPCSAETSAARLVEISEQGVDLEVLRGCARLEPEQLHALLAALHFDPAERICRAVDVARLLVS